MKNKESLIRLYSVYFLVLFMGLGIVVQIFYLQIFKGEQLQKYIKLIFEAYWRDNMDITDNNVLSNLLENIGFDFKDFFKKIEEVETKKKLKNLTHDAFDKNIFGAPTYVVNNKTFWGQDRFEYAIDELDTIS